jgi:hypothetical protein
LVPLSTALPKHGLVWRPECVFTFGVWPREQFRWFTGGDTERAATAGPPLRHRCSHDGARLRRVAAAPIHDYRVLARGDLCQQRRTRRQSWTNCLGVCLGLSLVMCELSTQLRPLPERGREPQRCPDQSRCTRRKLCCLQAKRAYGLAVSPGRPPPCRSQRPGD